MTHALPCCSKRPRGSLAGRTTRRKVFETAVATGVGAFMLSFTNCRRQEASFERAAGVADRGSWPQWRGPASDGRVSRLPARLSSLRVRWRAPLAGEGPAGITAADGRVAVADHGEGRDIYRLVDLVSGRECWRCERDNHLDLDYGSAPRAAPLLAGDSLFVLGAGGDLPCLRLADGEPRWRRNLLTDFGKAELPTWGYCSSPLLVDGKLVVNPGAVGASLVALTPSDGSLSWAAEGAAANYASLIGGRFGETLQVIGYDQKGLCGWACDSGRLLWRVETGLGKGYVVPTPVSWENHLIVAHERGTELYAFEHGGSIVAKPLASTRQLAPSLGTPTVAGRWLLGHDRRGVVAVSLEDRLASCWREPRNERRKGMAHWVAQDDGERALLFCQSG